MPLDISSLYRGEAFTTNNRRIIEESGWCGCYVCLARFDKVKVESFDGETAICPKCGAKKVIGSASGFVITDRFLFEMREFWIHPSQRSPNAPGDL